MRTGMSKGCKIMRGIFCRYRSSRGMLSSFEVLCSKTFVMLVLGFQDAATLQKGLWWNIVEKIKAAQDTGSRVSKSMPWVLETSRSNENLLRQSNSCMCGCPLGDVRPPNLAVRLSYQMAHLLESQLQKDDLQAGTAQTCNGNCLSSG
jgi:hypothetical protein